MKIWRRPIVLRPVKVGIHHEQPAGSCLPNGVREGFPAGNPLQLEARVCGLAHPFSKHGVGVEDKKTTRWISHE